MWLKISSPVLETRFGDAGGASTGAYKGDRSRGGPYRESEGFIVPFEDIGQLETFAKPAGNRHFLQHVE